MFIQKKQLETMQASQLHNQPKLWALIEASTERHSREVLNEKKSDVLKKEDKLQKDLKKKLFKKLPKLDFDTPIISFKRNKKAKKKQMPASVRKEELYFDFSNIPNSTKDGYFATTNDDNSLSDYNADITTPILDAPEIFHIEDSISNLPKASTFNSSIDEIFSKSELSLENVENKLVLSNDISETVSNVSEFKDIVKKIENLNKKDSID